MGVRTGMEDRKKRHTEGGNGGGECSKNRCSNCSKCSKIVQSCPLNPGPDLPDFVLKNTVRWTFRWTFRWTKTDLQKRNVSFR